MIASTSFLSFIATRDDGTQARQYAQILALLRTIPSVALSRTDIANLTGIRVSSVCARVHELRDDGLVIEPATRKCPHSGRMVKTVQAAPDLFVNSETKH